MDRLCVFFLNLSKLSLIRDFVLGVFSVANLVVFKNTLYLWLHVDCERRVVWGSDSPGKHVIQVESLNINLLTLALPLFSDCNSKGARRDWHRIFIHGLDHSAIQGYRPIGSVAHWKVVEVDLFCGKQFGKWVIVWVEHDRSVLIKALQMLDVRDDWHHRRGALCGVSCSHGFPTEVLGYLSDQKHLLRSSTHPLLTRCNHVCCTFDQVRILLIASQKLFNNSPKGN